MADHREVKGAAVHHAQISPMGSHLSSVGRYELPVKSGLLRRRCEAMSSTLPSTSMWPFGYGVPLSTVDLLTNPTIFRHPEP